MNILNEQLTEQEIADIKIYAELEDRMPDVFRDIIRVVEWSVSTKTPGGEVAAALQRLREIATKLEAYKGSTNANR